MFGFSYIYSQFVIVTPFSYKTEISSITFNPSAEALYDVYKTVSSAYMIITMQIKETFMVRVIVTGTPLHSSE